MAASESQWTGSDEVAQAYEEERQERIAANKRMLAASDVF